jgi:uncharacterized membrane protein (Fun14 family)
MEWNSLGWKCRKQKKIIALLMVICGLMVFCIYVAHMHLANIDDYAMANLAMEAAEMSYKCAVIDYQAQELEAKAAELKLQYEALEAEKQQLLDSLEPAPN